MKITQTLASVALRGMNWTGFDVERKPVTLFGMPVSVREDVPDDEIWIVDGEGTVHKIVNLGYAKT
jgi:hypothetical protein